HSLLFVLLSAVLSSPILHSSSSSSESNETLPSTATVEPPVLESLKNVAKIDMDEEISGSGEDDLSIRKKSMQDGATTTVEPTTVDIESTSQIPQVQLTERMQEQPEQTSVQNNPEGVSEDVTNPETQVESVTEPSTLETKHETMPKSTAQSDALTDSPIIIEPSTVSPEQNVVTIKESEVASTSPPESHTTSTQTTQFTTEPSPLDYKFRSRLLDHQYDNISLEDRDLCETSCSLASNCTVIDAKAFCTCNDGYSDKSIESPPGSMCSVCASAHSDLLIIFNVFHEMSTRQLSILRKITSKMIQVLDSKNTDNRVGLISTGSKAQLKFGFGSNEEEMIQWVRTYWGEEGRGDVAGAYKIVTEQVWTGPPDRKRHLILLTDADFNSCTHQQSNETLTGCTMRELGDEMSTLKRLGVSITSVYGETKITMDRVIFNDVYIWKRELTFADTYHHFVGAIKQTIDKLQLHVC
ncbi:hypothetical protein PFISCL1PPCAC_26514, partial [Pristionchus fissidentatus]